MLLADPVFLSQSHDWIRVRIQQMEPDLMEVGTTLDEAKSLRREHEELLAKLNVSFTFHTRRRLTTFTA